MTAERVLIVDDEAGIRFGVRQYLEAQGYQVTEADSCRAAELSFHSSRPDVAVLDHRLEDGGALDLLRRLRAIDPKVPLLVLTAHASVDLAVQAMKEGAENFLTKPLELPLLRAFLERALEQRRERQQRISGESRQLRCEVDPFAGTSPQIRELRECAEKVAVSDTPILLQGETGTGKSLLAKWLHQRSTRAEQPFVDLNCAGLTRQFLETELFGHDKGAFTGATSTKLGLFEVAHRGSVFLDEVADADLQVQPKLLKVLEEKRFRRLGDVRDRTVDIRLIFATHQDLSALVQEKKFRSDLYFRINTIPLRVPALRERREDIPQLARLILKQFAELWKRGPADLSEDAAAALGEYSWPGNVRELRNVLERALLLGDSNVLGRKDLRFEPSPLAVSPFTDTSLSLEEVERRYIEAILQEEQGRVESAAARLKVPKSSLYQKLKRFGISVPRR